MEFVLNEDFQATTENRFCSLAKTLPIRACFHQARFPRNDCSFARRDLCLRQYEMFQLFHGMSSCAAREGSSNRDQRWYRYIGHRPTILDDSVYQDTDRQ